MLAGCAGAASPSPTAPPAAANTVAPSTASLTAPTPEPPVKTLEPSAKVLKVFDSVPAGCAINEAYAGQTTPLERLTDCALPIGRSQTIPGGSIVTTSACGEAWLSTDCGLLYVFGGSNLRVSTCSSSVARGSGCVESGTIAWSGQPCEKEVAFATPSGTIRLEGTWISATYDPDTRVALFAVFDGVGEAVPVLDDAGQRVGPEAHLDAGTFWFSAPGDQPQDVAGLPARRPIPFSELPRVVHELHLETAFASVLRQARSDGVDVGGVPDIPTFTVRLGGPRFAESSAADDAVLRAFDWRQEVSAVLGRDDVTTTALVASSKPVDLSTVTLEPQAATNAMLEAKLFSALVTWDTSPEVDKIAQIYMKSLSSMQFAEFEYFAATDGHARPQETAAAIYNEFAVDSPVIWLDYHP